MSNKAEQVVEAAQSQLGGPYVYGAWGATCTPAMRRKYASANPDHAANIKKKCPVLSGTAKACSGCKWDGALAFDCRGFTHWCLLQVGIAITGGGATSQYNAKSNWVQQGTIDQMPDVVCCVFKYSDGRMQHTGLHIGGGKIIHCSSGVQTGKITDKGWTHYAIPIGLYDDSELAASGTKAVKAVKVMRKGSRGSDVSAMQELLNRLGYDCGEVDGIYGTKTAAAVRTFQAANGLTVDGIAGEQTLTVLAMRGATVGEAPAAPVEAAPEITYTVTIPGLTAEKAEQLLQQYPQAIKA